MAAELSEPRVFERGPYEVVGCYATYEGDDEAWGPASQAFFARKHAITNRVDDTILGFLYRPHRDDPSIPETVRAAFVGVEVADRGQVPEGMTLTHFSGGRFVTVSCTGDTEGEAAGAVGDGVQACESWAREHGYDEGDSCFCYSHEGAERPPYVEHVVMHVIERS